MRPDCLWESHIKAQQNLSERVMRALKHLYTVYRYSLNCIVPENAEYYCCQR